MPIGSWLGARMTAPQRAAGASPVVESLKAGKPSGGWGTMGQVGSSIAALSPSRSPIPAPAITPGPVAPAASPAPVAPAPVGFMDMIPAAARRANEAAKARIGASIASPLDDPPSMPLPAGPFRRIDQGGEFETFTPSIASNMALSPQQLSSSIAGMMGMRKRRGRGGYE